MIRQESESATEKNNIKERATEIQNIIFEKSKKKIKEKENEIITDNTNLWILHS